MAMGKEKLAKSILLGDSKPKLDGNLSHGSTQGIMNKKCSDLALPTKESRRKAIKDLGLYIRCLATIGVTGDYIHKNYSCFFWL